VILLIILIPLALFFRVPQKIGLARNPAAEVFSQTPDRATGILAIEELAASGYPTTGLRMYVYDDPDSGRLAYAVFDGEEGFDFPPDVSGDPVLDFLGRMSKLEALAESDVRVVAFYLRNSDGKFVMAMTADVDDARAYADGQMDESSFIKTLNGIADPVFVLSSGSGSE
jgi:hypothetical protein